MSKQTSLVSPCASVNFGFMSSIRLCEDPEDDEAVYLSEVGQKTQLIGKQPSSFRSKSFCHFLEL